MWGFHETTVRRTPLPFYKLERGGLASQPFSHKASVSVTLAGDTPNSQPSDHLLPKELSPCPLCLSPALHFSPYSQPMPVSTMATNKDLPVLSSLHSSIHTVCRSLRRGPPQLWATTRPLSLVASCLPRSFLSAYFSGTCLSSQLFSVMLLRPLPTLCVRELPNAARAGSPQMSVGQLRSF